MPDSRAAPYSLETLKLKAVTPTETQVLNAVLRYLEAEPRVARVWRQNSMAMVVEDGGKKRYVASQRDSRGGSLTVLDITGYMRDGRRLDIECKVKLPQPETVEKWRATPRDALHKDAQRYMRQLEYIGDAKADNVVAGFVTSVDEAKELIDLACGWVKIGSDEYLQACRELAEVHLEDRDILGETARATLLGLALWESTKKPPGSA